MLLYNYRIVLSNYSATWLTHHPNSTEWTAYWYRTMSWLPDRARPVRLFGDGRGVDRGRRWTRAAGGE